VSSSDCVRHERKWPEVDFWFSPVLTRLDARQLARRWIEQATPMPTAFATILPAETDMSLPVPVSLPWPVINFGLGSGRGRRRRGGGRLARGGGLARRRCRHVALRSLY
jgi:hypothetical protein